MSEPDLGTGGTRRQRGIIPPEVLSYTAGPIADVLRVRETVGNQVAGLFARTGALDSFSNLTRVANAYNDSAVSAVSAVSAASAVSAIERLSRGVVGDSMLTANFAGLSASSQLGHAFAEHTLGSVVESALQGQVDQLQSIAKLVVSNNNLLARLHPAAEVAKAVSLATRGWEDVVRASQAETRLLGHLTVAGETTGWATHTGLLLSEPDSERLDLVEEQVAVALGPAAASSELRTRLDAVSPELRIKLDAAWERIRKGGLNAGAEVAESLIEALDWTLRLRAPDEEVLAWHRSEGRAESELDSRGNPTKSLRIRYIARNRSDAPISLYAKSVKELADAIQKPKHRLTPTHEATLVSLAMTVEGVLYFALDD